jgi:alkanesulfonate monooxygenase SsuD/methylene tetrahydromethanopterin reductase-like flavin-dependent oxidoreductase (luciferase family)
MTETKPDRTVLVGGASGSTTADLVVKLCDAHAVASPRDKGRIVRWIAQIEGDPGRDIGRPTIDDAAALERIQERVDNGVSLRKAILAEARWLLGRGDERASLDSIRRRLRRKKLDTTGA